MLGGFCYLLYFCKKINDMEETKHIKISDYNYPLPDERIAKFPLPVRDQSKLLVYQHGQISETHFTSLPDYLEPGTLMIFNNTKVIQARLHFRKETGALIEIFCLEPIKPNDYVLNFQQTQHAAWLCMIGNLKKWKEGPLHKEMTVKGKTLTLTATRGECHGTSHWIDFTWDNPEVTFADILEFFGELPIPPYLNRETQESDKENLPDRLLENKRFRSRPYSQSAFHRTRIERSKRKRSGFGRSHPSRWSRHFQTCEKRRNRRPRNAYGIHFRKPWNHRETLSTWR